jgi:hypothetical protein
MSLSLLAMAVAGWSLKQPLSASHLLSKKYKAYLYQDSGRFTLCIGTRPRWVDKPWLIAMFKYFEDREKELEKCNAKLDRLVQEAKSGHSEQANNEDHREKMFLADDEKKVCKLLLSRRDKDIQYSIASILRTHGFAGFLLRIYPTPREVVVLIAPAWMVFGLLSIAPIAVTCRILRRRGIISPTACTVCRYNLFGLTHPLCPECGTPIPAQLWQRLKDIETAEKSLTHDSSTK